MSESAKRVLLFMNEVAGGRKLLGRSRELAEAGAGYVAVVAPQNQPAVGHVIDEGEIRDAALSRVEVTQAVLEDFGIDSVGAVLDPNPALALDDAVRSTLPDHVLISCLAGTRYGLLRRDLVEVARDNHPDIEIEHIPVRVEDDAVRWDLTHTLVVATQTVNSRDLIDHLKQKAGGEKPHRYTFICPRSGEVSREQVCASLATTLAELYRAEVDATGQPLSPEPFTAVKNAVANYRVDEVLISTLAGQSSKWLEDGLIEKVKGITDIPVEHFESKSGPGAPQAPAAATAGAGA